MGKRINEGKYMNRNRRLVEKQYANDEETPYFVTRMLDYENNGNSIDLIFADHSKIVITEDNTATIDESTYETKGNHKSSGFGQSVKSFAVVFKEFYDSIYDENNKFEFVKNVLSEFDSYNSVEGYDTEDDTDAGLNPDFGWAGDQYGHYSKAVKSRQNDLSAVKSGSAYSYSQKRGDNVTQGQVPRNEKVTLIVPDKELYREIFDIINQYVGKSFNVKLDVNRKEILLPKSIFRTIKSSLAQMIEDGELIVKDNKEEYLFDEGRTPKHGRRVVESEESSLSIAIEAVQTTLVSLSNLGIEKVTSLKSFNEYPLDDKFEDVIPALIEWLGKVINELNSTSVNESRRTKRKLSNRESRQEKSFVEQIFGKIDNTFVDSIGDGYASESDAFVRQILTGMSESGNSEFKSVSLTKEAEEFNFQPVHISSAGSNVLAEALTPGVRTASLGGASSGKVGAVSVEGEYLPFLQEGFK